MIEQSKFTYSPLGKVLQKQNKTKNIWGSRRKTKAFEEHGKQLVESNKCIKNDFNVDKDSVRLEEEKIKNLMNLLKKNLINFRTF